MELRDPHNSSMVMVQRPTLPWSRANPRPDGAARQEGLPLPARAARDEGNPSSLPSALLPLAGPCSFHCAREALTQQNSCTITGSHDGGGVQPMCLRTRKEHRGRQWAGPSPAATCALSQPRQESDTHTLSLRVGQRRRSGGKAGRVHNLLPTSRWLAGPAGSREARVGGALHQRPSRAVLHAVAVQPSRLPLAEGPPLEGDGWCGRHPPLPGGWARWAGLGRGEASGVRRLAPRQHS